MVSTPKTCQLLLHIHESTLHLSTITLITPYTVAVQEIHQCIPDLLSHVPQLGFILFNFLKDTLMDNSFRLHSAESAFAAILVLLMLWS